MNESDEFLCAYLAASPRRRTSALKVLRGEALISDPLDPDPLRPPLLLGMGEAAKYLGVSRPTLWRMIQAGRLEKVELFSGSHRVRRRDIEDMALKRRSPEILGSPNNNAVPNSEVK